MQILMTMLPYGMLLIIGFIFIRYKLKNAETIALQKEKEVEKELFLREFRKEYDPSLPEVNKLTSEETLQRLRGALKQDFVEEVSFKFFNENPNFNPKEIASIWTELKERIIMGAFLDEEVTQEETVNKLWKTMTFFPSEYALFCYRFFGKELDDIQLDKNE